jgi:cyanate permease
VTVLRAVSVTIAGVLPAFGVGALAVQVRSEFGVGPAAIGLATAVLFAVSGALARPLGSVVQRVGSRRGMALAALLSTVAMTAAALAPTFALLVAALVVGGVGNALAQPAANLSISEQIGPGRLGLAFGVKQSSIPAATMLAGLAVPGIALVFGWRWAMATGAVLALATTAWALTAGRGARPSVAGRHLEPDRGLPRRGLVLLTVGGGLGAAASTCLGVFLVDSGVRAGLEPAHAGLLFAGCSLLGLSGRVGLGWAMDRSAGRSPYVLIANLLTAGAVGYVLLASGGEAAFAVGAVLAYGAGWAWTGLFHYAIVRDNRVAAASATGFVQTGLSLGAASGPLAFGVLAEATSYGPAWAAVAALAVVAAATVRGGRRTVRRSRGLPVRSLRRRPADAPTPPARSHPPDTHAKGSP